MAEPRTPTHTTSDDGYREPMRVANLAYADAIDGPVDPFRAAVRAAVDAARAGERRRNISHILTRAVINERRGYNSAAYALRDVAGLIERGEFDDAAARS